MMSKHNRSQYRPCLDEASRSRAQRQACCNIFFSIAGDTHVSNIVSPKSFTIVTKSDMDQLMRFRESRMALMGPPTSRHLGSAAADTASQLSRI